MTFEKIIFQEIKNNDIMLWRSWGDYNVVVIIYLEYTLTLNELVT